MARKDLTEMSDEERAQEELRLRKKKEANIRCYAKKAGMTYEEYLRTKTKRVLENPPDYEALIKESRGEKVKIQKLPPKQDLEEFMLYRLTRLKAFFLLKEKFINKDWVVSQEMNSYQKEFNKTLSAVITLRSEKLWNKILEKNPNINWDNEPEEADIKNSDIQKEIIAEIEEQANIILIQANPLLPEEILHVPFTKK
jgi:hypothetical protein